MAFNVISLIAILTAPETLGIDMNRTDSAAPIAGEDGLRAGEHEQQPSHLSRARASVTSKFANQATEQ